MKDRKDKANGGQTISGRRAWLDREQIRNRALGEGWNIGYAGGQDARQGIEMEARWKGQLGITSECMARAGRGRGRESWRAR